MRAVVARFARIERRVSLGAMGRATASPMPAGVIDLRKLPTWAGANPRPRSTSCVPQADGTSCGAGL